jgi:hypothetical protein
MNNVRVWEEGGRCVALYEGGEVGGHESYLYEAGPGTRQHVDLRSTVCSVHGSSRFRATGISRGHPHRSRLLDNPSCWRCGPLYNIIE